MSNTLPLSSSDQPHLRLDTPAHPMNWVLMLEFSPDGAPFSLASLRARLAQRVPESELYQWLLPQRPRRSPRFTRAEVVDPIQHATQRQVADRAGVLNLVADLHSSQIRRDIPPWDFTLIQQRDTGAQTLLLRVHHALSDGLGAPGFVALLADTPSGTTAEFQRFINTPRFEVDSASLFATLTAGMRGSRPGRRPGRRRVPVRPKGTRATRQVTEVTVPIALVRQQSTALHVSTKEWLYAACCLAFTRAFPEQADRPLRLMCAVTLDPTIAHTGNAASLAVLDLPDAQDRLSNQVQGVHTALRTSDPMGQARDVPRTSQALGRLPWRAQVLLTQLLASDSWDLAVGVNPAFTPCDQILGREVNKVVGIPPLLGRELIVSALILRDQVTIGMMVDPTVLPDVDLFAKHLQELIGAG